MVKSIFDYIAEYFGDEVRTIHELKTWPESFEPLLSRQKRAEVRRDDRDYQVGDLILLREWDPNSGQYSGRQLFREITHIVLGGQFGLPEELCVLSVR